MPVVDFPYFSFMVYTFVGVLDQVSWPGQTKIWNNPYNYWIFLGLNTIYIAHSFTKFILAILDLEKIFIFGEDTVRNLDQIKLYIWGPG